MFNLPRSWSIAMDFFFIWFKGYHLNLNMRPLQNLNLFFFFILFTTHLHTVSTKHWHLIWFAAIFSFFLVKLNIERRHIFLCRSRLLEPWEFHSSTIFSCTIRGFSDTEADQFPFFYFPLMFAYFTGNYWSRRGLLGRLLA